MQVTLSEGSWSDAVPPSQARDPKPRQNKVTLPRLLIDRVPHCGSTPTILLELQARSLLGPIRSPNYVGLPCQLTCSRPTLRSASSARLSRFEAALAGSMPPVLESLSGHAPPVPLPINHSIKTLCRWISINHVPPPPIDMQTLVHCTSSTVGAARLRRGWQNLGSGTRR